MGDVGAGWGWRGAPPAQETQTSGKRGPEEGFCGELEDC